MCNSQVKTNKSYLLQLGACGIISRIGIFNPILFPATSADLASPKLYDGRGSTSRQTRGVIKNICTYLHIGPHATNEFPIYITYFGGVCLRRERGQGDFQKQGHCPECTIVTGSTPLSHSLRLVPPAFPPRNAHSSHCQLTFNGR